MPPGRKPASRHDFERRLAHLPTSHAPKASATRIFQRKLKVLKPPLDQEAEVTGDRHFWMGVAVLVAQLVLAALASYLGLVELGVVLFVATPVSVGVTAGLINTWLQMWKLLGVLLAVPSLILLFVGVEGLLCVALAAPILAACLALGYSIGWLVRRWWVGRRPGRHREAAMWLPVGIFLVSATGEQFVGVDRHVNAATSSIELPSGKPEVFAALVHVDTVRVAGTWLHALGLPQPLASRLDTLAVGARRTCYLSDGIIAERVTALDIPDAIEMDMGGATMGRAWLSLDHDRYRLERLPGGGTRVTHVTHFRSTLRPRAYWAAVERYTVRAQHRVVFDNLRATLAASDD